MSNWSNIYLDVIITVLDIIIVHGKRSLRLDVGRVLLFVSWVISAISAWAKHSLASKVLVWSKAIILLMRSDPTPCTLPFAWVSCIQIIGQRSHMHLRYYCYHVKRNTDKTAFRENVRLYLLRYTLFCVFYFICYSIFYSVSQPAGVMAALATGGWALEPAVISRDPVSTEPCRDLSIHWEKRHHPNQSYGSHSLALSTTISLDWS